MMIRTFHLLPLIGIVTFLLQGYPVGMTTPAMFLVPISGPPLAPISLVAKPGGAAIGRHENCDLKLPADAEKVSRNHARFVCDDDGQWRVVDLKSAWGTFVNGVKIDPGVQSALRENDLIRITPWTFRFSSDTKRRGVATADDAGQTIVRSIPAGESAALKEDLLKLLLDTASSIHEAATEQQLAEQIMDAAVRGTGLNNAIVLRPVDTGGKVEVVASKLSPSAQGGITFSRSLLAVAERGEVAEISQTATGNISESIVSMKINAALCVPIMLGPSPAQFLYLDSRGAIKQSLHAHASAFGVALGRMASLALSNLKRIEFEKRQAALDNDLKSAAVAQKWILPKRHNQIDRFTCVGESRPGQYVGGDFFDVIPLPGGKLAVAVGDVSGKGVAASVLMTAAQGFLHSALLAHGDPARAATALNLFISPRRDASKFVTLWVGVFDPLAKQLHYVDAGHSYAALLCDGGPCKMLDAGGGPPIGVLDTQVYIAETIALPDTGKVMVVSDGIIEQFGLVSRDGKLEQQQFEMAGVTQTLAHGSGGADEVADVFTAVIEHAGTDKLADDATAVVVRW